MKSNRVTASLFFICTAWFSGCIKKIDYTLKEPAPKLVLSSLLMPDSLLQVYVSGTKSVLDTGRLMINNAEVKLYQNNIFFADLKPKGNGLYMCNFNFTPFEGRSYKIIANASGYEEVSAETSIPMLNKGYSLKVIYPYKYDQNQEPTTYFELTINDPANEENFYELLFFWKDPHKFSQLSFYSVKTDSNILKEEGDLDYDNSSFFISDKLFNGQKVAIPIELIEFYAFGATDPQVYYSLRSVSKTKYKFGKYLLRHLYNQNSSYSLDDPLHLLFSGEPTNMYSNVNGGYGAVVGYTGELKEVKP